MRRWAVRGSLVLIGVFGLMLMPSVALADNCSGGGLLDCWGSASAAAAAAAAAAALAVGGFFPTAGDSSQQGPNDPRGGASDPLRDLMNDLENANTVANAPPPEPGVMETVYDELKDFVRAQREGFRDFVEGVEDVGEEMRHDIAKEIAEDFKEDPTDRYED